jgi:hypothetical protein
VPLLGTSAEYSEGGLGPEQCSCLLSTASMALFLVLAVLLPILVGWRTERVSKAAFLSSRGLALRVRAPLLPRLDSSLRAAGVAVPWGRAARAPAAAAAGALGVWCAADALVRRLSPECRGPW